MPERSPGLVRPPAVNTGESRTASRLELFFDLAYVVAVAELARAFASDLTWHGAAVFAGLFTVIWSSWVGFTLYANRFDTDDVVFRLIKLAATLTAAGCAASAADADSSTATAFGASFLAGRVLLVGLYLRAWRHLGHVRTTTTTYLVAMSTTCGVWAVSLTVDGAARYACWALAILIDAATPVMASLRGNAAPLHVEHLPERFALLVILVLGEAVAGLALAVHNADWAWRSLTLAAAAFVAVAALWWNYFDAGTPLGEDNLEDLEEEAEHTAPREEDTSHPDAGPTGGWPVVRARLQEDLFVYGHLPVTFGIAAAAVGLEEMALHPQDRPAAASWVLVGGLVLFYAGMTAIVAGTGGSWRQAWPWPGCAAFLVPPIAFWAAAPGVVASAVAVTVVLAVGGTAMQRRRSRTTGAEPERRAA